ncbi:predicted protein [Plenodomus lingam JN3]|uniref:Predicted protein n=1 Tax=Leptosphaeria maculans (strain JN3 / isolate v23.1.3 / race Av1-4-5-6-7-8) TaxID=985895 RepID=E4ZHL2_LEPMJ|nr:predicted protein [Plenodomus lingam JN3]CBX90845.1 predicted protein [Plenodomus lingam JN3]
MDLSRKPSPVPFRPVPQGRELATYGQAVQCRASRRTRLAFSPSAGFSPRSQSSSFSCSVASVQIPNGTNSTTTLARARG